MKDNKNENIIQEEIVYTDADSAYDSRMVLRHRRESYFTLTDTAVTQQKKYEIGGMRYLVRSIFPWDSKRTAEENIKHLLRSEIDKVS